MNLSFKSCNLLITRLKPRLPITFLAATICSKELRDPKYKRAKPFPYESKKYNYFRRFFDGTLKRFDENTKVIVVDGNIGAGKTSFAKELADHFDMKYIPEPNFDRYYINCYGEDMRKLDSVVPLSFRSCDIKTFYQNPKDPNVSKLQFKMFQLRYVDYIFALSHLFHTGQGLVMDRSVHSDFVFMETMCKMGYVSSAVRDFYYKLYNNCVVELLRPHLIVYLDVNPEVALQRIKERNDPIEINSKVLTLEYLQAIEHFYKKNHLNKLSKHSEILVYDWNDYGDVEVVVEDIERMDFRTYDPYSDRFKDWYPEDNEQYASLRYKYSTENVIHLLNYSTMLPRHLPELCYSTVDVLTYREIMEKVPGMIYSPGYNRHMGDSIWFKMNGFKQNDVLDYFPQLRG